jgi:hypothetical protein
MDCSPEPVYRTQYVEKIVEVPVYTQVSPSTPTISTKSVDKIEEKQAETVSTSPIEQKSEEKTEKTTENNQDINFRNILNGLIKATTVQKTCSIKSVETDKNTENEPESVVEKPKFKQTIEETDYNSQRSNNGKIDFGDLTLKAAKEGYKVKISSKDSFVPTGILRINKLNLYASLLIYSSVALSFGFMMQGLPKTIECEGTSQFT